jgi:hypothetical protein
MLLTWPLSAAGFNLQQAASLDTAAWNDNTNPVTIVNNSNIVTNDPTTAAVYFRLRK